MTTLYDARVVNSCKVNVGGVATNSLCHALQHVVVGVSRRQQGDKFNRIALFYILKSHPGLANTFGTQRTACATLLSVLLDGNCGFAHTIG